MSTSSAGVVRASGTGGLRRRALAAGILYLLTFVSIPTLVLYKPVKDDVGSFILGTHGSETAVLWGGLSEILVGLAGVSTALVLLPVLRRQSDTAALTVVAARLLETTLIFIGVVSMLAITTLRHDAVGAGSTDRASLVVAVVGAPLLLADDVALFSGAYAKGSALDGLAALPVAGFELAFGLWLIVKGFNPSSPVLTRPRSENAPAPSFEQTRQGAPGVDLQ